METQIQVLDEIIDNAIELPVESQDLLLIIAKAMRYTRNCVIRQNVNEQKEKSKY